MSLRTDLYARIDLESRETKRASCPFCAGPRVFFKSVDPANALRWVWICFVCRQHERRTA